MAEKIVYVILAVIVVAVAGTLFSYALRWPVSSQKCGIESCHGLEITCGPNIPDVCTMIYQFGDRCRQYASCGKVNGECQLVQSAKFDECKSCVEKCLRDFQDVIEASECESKC